MMSRVFKKCTGVPSAIALALTLLMLAAGPAQAQQIDLFAEAGSTDGATPLAACSAGPYPLCGGDCPPLFGCVPAAGGPTCLCKPETLPCSICGPGPHFVDLCGPFPPIGPDLIAKNGVVAGIDVDMDCVRDVNLVLLPCPPPNDLLRVDKRQGPLDDSNQFPGTRPIDGHMDVIDTEIVSMCLTGSGVTLAAGPGGPASFPLSSSLGAIAEVPANPALADSFFDVFFELQGVPGGPAYNKTPIAVQSQITCLPPSANYHHPIGLCLPLYTRGVCAGGPNAGNQCIRDVNCPGSFCANQQHIGNLVAANHSVNQPVCDPQQPTCNGNCPAGDQCQPTPTGCNCTPIPCDAGSPPQCGGACPPGLICTGNIAGDPCHCEPPPCEQGPWPQCGGPCPPGLLCRPDASGLDLCNCEPPPCDQTSPPLCGGACPNGEACIPNALGQCACDQGPQPCDVTAPSCNGVCPVASDICVVDPVGCHCETPPCEQSLYPLCGGPCPPGQACAPDTTGVAACRCEPLPCDQTAPACNGPCPNGLACVPGAAGAPCSCQPVPCDQTVPPSCNGDCPVGLICNADPTGHCNCQQPACDQSAPMCNGPCPNGQVCLGNAAGGCTCVPGPCSQSPAPQCGGTCPSGTVCANTGANCDCVPVPCQQGAYPQCSGPCPAPLICAAIPGATSCNCIQPACDQSAPACNGPCPIAGETCVSDAVGCHCEAPPLPCDQTLPPQCGGTCTNGALCHPNAVGKCTCDDLPPACDQSAPACNGLCPTPGDICIPNAVGCGCVSPACDQSAPACNGTCPNGQVCVGDAAGCQCSPVPCNQSAPACDGLCPNGQICLSGAVGCFCEPTPCGPTGPHQCGGTCPQNTVCQPTPTDGCGCAPIQCQQSQFPQCGGTCPAGSACYAPLIANSCLCCPTGIPIDVVDGVLFTSKKVIIWNPHPLPCGWWWHLYKLTAVMMPDVDDNGVADDYGAPSQCHLPDATATDPDSPQVGQVFYYQVTIANTGGEGPMGVASNGLPRPNVTPCP